MIGSPLSQTSTQVKRCPAKHTTPENVVELSFPEYVLHTDTKLEQCRKQYFELAKAGEERNCQMSKDLRCRLIRNTMTSMIAILRATGDRDRYPSKPEITAMAKRTVLYYPMLQGRDLSSKYAWVGQMHPGACLMFEAFIWIFLVTGYCVLTAIQKIEKFEITPKDQSKEAPTRGAKVPTWLTQMNLIQVTQQSFWISPQKGVAFKHSRLPFWRE